jgi:hypothetical protein
MAGNRRHTRYSRYGELNQVNRARNRGCCLSQSEPDVNKSGKCKARQGPKDEDGTHASSCKRSAVIPRNDCSSRERNKPRDIHVGRERKNGTSVEDKREQVRTN